MILHQVSVCVRIQYNPDLRAYPSSTASMYPVFRFCLATEHFLILLDFGSGFLTHETDCLKKYFTILKLILLYGHCYSGFCSTIINEDFQ